MIASNSKQKGGKAMKVKANFNYNDTELKRLVTKDEIIEVDKERANVLTTKKWDGTPFCSIVEESKVEEPKVEKAVRKPKAEKAVKSEE